MKQRIAPEIGPAGEPAPVYLGTLPIGTQFTCPWNPELTGTLVDSSPSCATVTLVRPVQTRTFTATDKHGNKTEITLPASGGRERATWSNGTLVIPSQR